MTRGFKSSERKACYDGFYAGFALAVFGLHKGIDPMGLAVLIPAVILPLKWYALNRTITKWKNGEEISKD